MNVGKTLYVTDRQRWREWLAENYNKEKEIWLIYPKKTSGKPRILYNDAVEEALSFGWIDSTAKRIDENCYAQRFSPRNPKSKYSESNKQRLRELVKRGLVLPSVKAAVAALLDEEFVVPADILEEIKTNKMAWDNFQKFTPEYVRIRIAFIEGARNRPDEFKKRLRYFIKMTEKNKQIGFGGIEKHY
ncbi:MAG TPA: YdeI/OmpD-associated family protein [Candidatus Binatia bacterium]|nr:YdeI/OmpD-associated family protein [Candidatus Binatia bacterium]